MSRGRSAAREAFWRQHVEGWQRSGLSQQEYCQEHGLVLSTLQTWRRRLKSNSAEVQIVQVGQAFRPAAAPLALLVGRGGRYRLEISHGVHPATLATVLEVLESR